MSELERELRELGLELEYPAAPDLASGILARLPVTPPRRSRPVRRTLVLAFAIFLLAVGTAFAVPQSRHAILDWLGLEGVTVERVDVLPTLPEVPGGASLALGTPVSLSGAADEVDFGILVPQALGAPDGVYVDRSVPGGRVTLLYRPSGTLAETEDGVGLLVTEFLGTQAPELIGKLAGSGTVVEPVTVEGSPGIWIEGPPHVFFYRDPNGEFREQTVRLAGNTLLLQQGDRLVRLEADVTKAEAIRIAESLAAP